MTDDITAKRLKKKVLDRWEDEGGRIVADPAGAAQGRPKCDHVGELDQLSGSLGKSAAGAPTSPTKGRKPAVK
jgi:hypothetical protein